MVSKFHWLALWGCSVFPFSNPLRDCVLSTAPSQFFDLSKFHLLNSFILESALAGKNTTKWARGWLESAGTDIVMSSFYQALEGKKENKSGVFRPAGCDEKLQSLGTVNATQSGFRYGVRCGAWTAGMLRLPGRSLQHPYKTRSLPCLMQHCPLTQSKITFSVCIALFEGLFWGGFVLLLLASHQKAFDP